MQKPVMSQGSLAIGDFFFMNHIMANLYFSGRSVCAVIPGDLPDDHVIRYLYSRATFLEGVFDTDCVKSPAFERYAEDCGFEYSTFLANYGHMRDLKFIPLKRWFSLPEFCMPDGIGGKYVVFQVASSANKKRPRMDNLAKWVELCFAGGYTPIFIGIKTDEEVFMELYPEMECYRNTHMWRYGKDSMATTLGILKNASAVISHSSSMAPAAALMGVPSLILWDFDQYCYYSPLVHHMLGSPVHLVHHPSQCGVMPAFFTDIITQLKFFAESLYSIS